MTTPNIIFIVPYRNRENDKIHFDVYMKYLLEDLNSQDYEIYFSHQNDKRAFNRGAVKNIGFIAMRNKYPDTYKNITFVFNDIDILPIRKNMLNYNTTSGIVKHFYGFDYALGGIFSITGEDFERCNGFPNLYGWGMEDNAMNDRVITNNIKIDRSVFYPIRSNKIINIFSDPRRIINNKEPLDFKRKQLIDNLNDINNLEYTIVSNKENSLKNSSNEFIINISKYRTLKNPLDEEYYVQDVSLTGKLYPNAMEKQRSRDMWSMKRLIGNSQR